jgi:ATP-dependent RNA helicase DDX49/DBP8
MATLFGKSSRKRTRDEIALTARRGPHEERAADDPAATTPAASALASAITSSSNTSTRAYASFADLGLVEPLVQTCRSLGLKRPTAVQRAVIPFLLQHPVRCHVLALAATGSGKTAAFGLPLLQHLQADPYGIYAVVLTPTRELAKQCHQQLLALGAAYKVTSVLVTGGCDAVRQANDLVQKRPHFCVATPGRLAELLRGPSPPRLANVRYLVMDEADRLLAAAQSSGFERDVAEVLLHCNPTKKRQPCQTLLFSATWTESLASLEDMAGAGGGRLPLQKFILTEDSTDVVATGQKDEARDSNPNPHPPDKTTEHDDDNDEEKETKNTMDATQQGAMRPKIPAGLKQEYVFMPARVRDAYLVTAIRRLLANGGRPTSTKRNKGEALQVEEEVDEEEGLPKGRSAILFVSTCERCALVSQLLTLLGVQNVALHSLLSQNRRLAALGKFQSEQVRLLVATDVAARGLDIPSVDLVINVELPRQAVNYIHRVGRTARAGRRGRALSLVAPDEVALVQAAEKLAGRPLLACPDVKDEHALACLGPVLKATRLAKMRLQEIGFDELLLKFRERKVRARQERRRIQKRLSKQEHRHAGQSG